MEQRVDGKGRENKREADAKAKKVVATRTVDKLLEQSRLSAPGSVGSHGTQGKKEELKVKASVPSSTVGNEKEKRKPVRKRESRDKEKAVAEEKESGSKSEATEGEEKSLSKEKGATRLNKLGGVGRWFQILCFVHIPLFGFLYMLVKALRRKTPEEERYFAIAYLLYRILILFLALTILYVLYKVGLQFVDGILDYAGMKS